MTNFITSGDLVTRLLMLISKLLRMKTEQHKKCYKKRTKKNKIINIICIQKKTLIYDDTGMHLGK